MNLKQEVANYKEAFDQRLKRLMDFRMDDSSLGSFYGPVKEFIMAGGKRLRPFSVLLGYIASGGKDMEETYLPAISVELFHNYTLIHDDIMDNDETRRGKPTVWKKLEDKNLAILVGDGVFGHSQKTLLSSDSLKGNMECALRRMTDVHMQLLEGQALDESFEDEKSVSESQYLEMARKKTGVLLGYSFELGAMVAQAPKEIQDSLRAFGENVGIAFQLQDDIIDLGYEKGHDRGSDIRSRKSTLLMIKTLENADKQQSMKIREVYGNSKASDKDIADVISIIEGTGALKYCQDKAKHLVTEAKQMISDLALEPKYKGLLEQLADYAIERKK